MIDLTRSIFAQASTQAFTTASGVDAGTLRGVIVVLICVGFFAWGMWVAYGRFRAYQTEKIDQYTLLMDVLLVFLIITIVGSALFGGLG